MANETSGPGKPVVAVTGGATGIGAAIAAGFCRDGSTVVVLGRNEERLAEFASSHDCRYEVVDVTREEDVDAAFARIADSLSPVSILVNNAGAAEAAAFTRTDADLWQRMLGVNLDGVFHCTRAVVPGMVAGGFGRVINIASTAALKGYAYVTAYCAAKHAVLGLTRSLAIELARKGVTVNAVCPGYTDTDIVARSVQEIVSATGRSEEEALAELVKSNPQGRLITPEEVASVALWLAGPDAASITGQAIAVAGGEVT